MFLVQFVVNIIVSIFGCLGIIFLTSNILTFLMSIELFLLGINLNFIVASLYLDDIIGQIFALFILTVAAAESALGLSVLISFFNIRGNIEFSENSLTKN